MATTKAGSPTGSGNPPGEHSSSYLADPGTGEGNFINNQSYRGNMHVGINERATEAGNQPKEDKTESIEKRSCGPALP